MIFVTVGTQFPFDRLVRAIDEAAGKNGFDEQVFAQVGTDSYCPKNFESVPELEKAMFDWHLGQADSIISHAGMGTIAMALDSGKPMLVMPRLRERGEAVNNHQLAIARKFEEQGYILVAYGAEHVPGKIEQLKTFVPRQRKPDAEVVAERISTFLNELSES